MAIAVIADKFVECVPELLECTPCVRGICHLGGMEYHDPHTSILVHHAHTPAAMDFPDYPDYKIGTHDHDPYITSAAAVKYMKNTQDNHVLSVRMP